MADDDSELEELVKALQLSSVHDGSTTSVSEATTNSSWKSSLCGKVLITDKKGQKQRHGQPYDGPDSVDASSRAEQGVILEQSIWFQIAGADNAIYGMKTTSKGDNIYAINYRVNTNPHQPLPESGTSLTPIIQVVTGAN